MENTGNFTPNEATSNSPTPPPESILPQPESIQSQPESPELIPPQPEATGSVPPQPEPPELPESYAFLRMPAEIQAVCKGEREAFNTASKLDCSFNLFTTDANYQNPAAFNKKTSGFKEIIDTPGFWKQERVMLQEYGVRRQVEEAKALSESMRTAEREMGIPPTIYILRGISGSGKTYACAHAGFPGMILNEQKEPTGTLATDNSKADLYPAGGTSDQIHAESSSMYRKVKRQWKSYVRERGGDCSEIHDRVFDDPDDIVEVINEAKETGRALKALDIDVPYVVSAVRVLQRPKGSPEPHPNYGYLEDAFAAVRYTRFAAGKEYEDAEHLTAPDQPGKDSILGQFQQANTEGVGVDYRLFCYDFESQPKVIQKEAARLETDPATGITELKIIDPRLFMLATSEEYTKREIESVKQMVINQEFVDWYCNNFFNPDEESQRYANEVRAALAEYVAKDPQMTIYEALDDKNK